MTKSTATVRKTMLLVGFAFLLTATSTFGEKPPLWGGLEPGPYGVGFKTIELFDYSRTFQPARDYFGTPIEGETARPIQICYWYPAVDTNGTAMTYGEYSFPYPADSRLFALLSSLQNRDIGSIYARIGNNQGLASQIMNYELRAIRDASPARGVFPLIVYHGSENGGYNQNVVLCEYLATHGFVVATTHTVGGATVNATEQASDVEAVTRDKEQAVATMRGLEFVNTEKLGLIGYNYGVTTAFIHQMRNFAVNAVATLHGKEVVGDGEWAALYKSNSYDPKRMRVPWLQLWPSQFVVNPDPNPDGGMRYCRLYSAYVPSVRPAEFSVYGIISAVAGIDTTRTIEEASKAQAVLGEYLRRFFDATLNDNQASLDWLGPRPGSVGQVGEGTVFYRRDAEDLPPTGDQFLNIIQTHGLTHARELCESFKIPTVETPLLADGAWTQLGYQFLQRGDLPSAVQIFAWGVAAWPTSANAWDSYGEACAASGDLATGLANYRKALEILPNDTQLMPAMRTQLETSIPANIQRLEQEIAAQGKPAGESK